MTGEHVHNWALSALVACSELTQSEIARDAAIAPPHLSHLMSGRRAGSVFPTRARLAAALGVRVEAITCWCDDRTGNHGGGR